MFKIIKINAKEGYFLHEPTWMRRGAHGHVAVPRGPARMCLRGTEVTCISHIYMYYIWFIVSISIHILDLS